MRRCSRCDWRRTSQDVCDVCAGRQRRRPLPPPRVEAARPVMLRTWAREVQVPPAVALELARALRTARGLGGTARTTRSVPAVAAVDGLVVVRLMDRWGSEAAPLTYEQAMQLADQIEAAATAAGDVDRG